MSETPPRSRMIAWCMYDWANSAYSAIVLSFVFAPYFLNHVVGDEVRGTVLWSNAITASAILICILSPVIGAFGDKGGRRRMWLFLFSAIAIVASAGMWGVTPHTDSILLALVLLAISNAAFELAYVFYNAMLPEVATPERLGRVSGWGWALGYFGALVAMGIVFFLLLDPDPPLFGLDAQAQEPVRLTAPFAAVWFLVFMLPLVIWGPPDRPTGLGTGTILREGFGELWQTIKGLPKTPSIAWYLVAHMIYIDGINTLIVFGPLFAAGSFGFSATDVLLYGISFFVAAGAGSLALGWAEDRIGSKPMLLISLALVTGTMGVTAFVHDATVFWILSMVLAFFLGPVQSVSRSLMARLAPEETRTQLFGLYALAGRATAPLGPALLGIVVASYGDQRAGAVVIAGLTVLGLLLLLPVREKSQA